MIRGNRKPKTVFFMGNSLMFRNGAVTGGRRVPNTAYSTIIASKNCSMQDYSVGGISTTTMIANFSTVLAPYLTANDVVFLWEGVNDQQAGQTAAQCYANYQAYSVLCRAKGAKVVVGTTIPNTIVGSEAVLAALNILILADNNVSWDATVDMRILHFQTVADCTDLTYYLADEIHATTAGSDLLAAPVATSILTLL